MQALRAALTPWRALLLAALLLAAQAGGLVHRVAHGPFAAGYAAGLSAGHSAGQSAGQSAAHAAAQATGVWGHAAPQAHTHDHGQPASEAVAECRLYDQLLGHADALLVTALADASPPADAATPPPTRVVPSRSQAAAYQARAPPLA